MALRALSIIAGLAVLSALTLLTALSVGSISVPPVDLWEVFAGRADATVTTVVLDLRLPRALAAFATGGLLALAGAMMQVLLRNPLADPYILGVSGGAAVAALLGIMLGFGGFWIDVGAFVGAMAVTLLVFSLAQGPGGWTPTRLLLTGVVIAAGMSAVVSLLLALGQDSSLKGMLFWLMGDFSYVEDARFNLIVLALATAAGILLARHLNVLARGEQQALILGVSVKPMRIGIFLLSSLLTALAVTTAGSIGFVGLLVPHLVRLAAGADHRIVVPGSALAGGILLMLADTAARTVLAPRQLPVGALTALFGVPLFLILLRRPARVT
ncbi:MAG: iron ABC transporter permease [Gammaproteobacteria bacterium]